MLAPARSSQQDDIWFRSLGEERSRRNVLTVTLTETPDTWVDRWRARAGGRPEALGFVTVDKTRSATATSDGALRMGNDVSARVVSSPDDLTGLGIAVDGYLSEWDGSGTRSVVWLDSLTVLLQYVELRRAFRFLHVLLGRIRKAGADAMFHLDPDAHDERTVATLRSLFDTVATPDE